MSEGKNEVDENPLKPIMTHMSATIAPESHPIFEIRKKQIPAGARAKIAPIFRKFVMLSRSAARARSSKAEAMKVTRRKQMKGSALRKPSLRRL